MPAVQSPAKVLVSGANGYLGIWVVRSLLDEGYSVRATVRALSKGAYLAQLFKDVGDRFELVEVPDITIDGAFDEAVKGIDAIQHTASPFHYNHTDPEDYIVPAVRGTVGILESALKHGTSVKRVVVTSSCAAVFEIYPDMKDPVVYDESNWNEKSIKDYEAQGKSLPPGVAYLVSKTKAEKAAHEFVAKHKGSIKWDVVTLCPPWIYGPALHEVDDVKSLNTSALIWYNSVIGPDAGSKEHAATEGAWVDVRDIAKAHVLSIQKEEAGNQRFIITPGTYTWQDWIDAVNSLDPSPLPGRTFNKGTPGSGKGVVQLMSYNTEKAAKVLGIKYRSMEETARDTLADFARRGW